MTTQSSHPKSTLGVLFVHGLGDHTRGATLTHWGQALMQCIDNWIEGGKPLGTPLHQLKNVKIAYASVEAQDGERQEPPYATVEFTAGSTTAMNKAMQSQLNNQRWLLAESHWDSSYPPPTYAELVLWAVDALPWTILTHVNKTLRRAEYGIQEGTNGWGRLMGAYILLLTTLMLSPFILFVVVLLSVLSALPIPYVSTFVAAAQRRLANTVGDSYVLVGNPISGEVIYSRLLRDLTWLCERCDAVAIIAHSQGAAVAHRVIRNNAGTPEVEKIKLLVTLGQGLSKLNSIAYRSGADAFRAMWGAVIAILAVALASLDLVFNLRFAASRFADSIANVVTLRIFDGVGIAIWLIALIVSSIIVAWGRHLSKKRMFNIPPWINWLLLLGIWLAIAAYVFIIVQPGQNSDTDETARFFVGAVIFLGVLCSHIFMRLWEKANRKELILAEQQATDAQEFQEKYELTTLWHDYFTRKDLVPNGPLLDGCQPGMNSKLNRFESIEVYNKGSAVGDHSWYWENIEEFAYPVSHGLVDLSNQQPPSLVPRMEPVLQQAIAARTRRVRLLVRLNQLLVVAFIIVGGLILTPTLYENMGRLPIPASLDIIATRALTLINWTVLPKLLSGFMTRIVGDNQVAATFLTYGVTLLFLFSFLRLVIHILWMISRERPGRSAFYKALHASPSTTP